MLHYTVDTNFLKKDPIKSYRSLRQDAKRFLVKKTVIKILISDNKGLNKNKKNIQR